MSDWFSRWYVPRAEYQRMVEYYAVETADLRATIEQLRNQLRIEEMCSVKDFISEPTPEPDLDSTNVIKVDFPRKKG